MYADRQTALARLILRVRTQTFFLLLRTPGAALLCLTLAAFVTPAFGQETATRDDSADAANSAGLMLTTGPLSGRVLDAAGAVIEGAIVTLKNLKTGAERAVTISADGAFRFVEIPPGEYQLSVTAANFSAPPRNVTLFAGTESREVEIRMTPRGFDEFVTINSGDAGFQATTATTAMRTDTLLRDTPQSIQVITREVIEEQQAVTINDVVRNVSGVSVPNSSGGRAEDFTIRGFTSSRNTYKDGFRNDFNSNRTSHEISNVERVEVLKGPASILFGRLDPSGVVNLVTKKPLAEHYYSAQLTGGKFGLFRPTIDAGGPLNAKKTLLYRFNAAYENTDTFRDFVEKERLFAAPSLTWIIGGRTTLNFDAEVLKGTSLIDRGLIAVGDGIAPVSIRTYLGDPGIPYKYQQLKGGAILSHAFTSQWSLRSAFRLALNKADYDSRQPRRLRADNRTLELSLDFADQSLQTYYWQNDVSARLQTGAVKHSVVFGADFGSETFSSVTLSGPTRTIDIFDPRYDFAPGALRLRGHSRTTNLSGGLYAQDLISLRDDLKLLVGGRFDYYDQENDNRLTQSVRTAIDRKFTPRVGLVYQPAAAVSLYASYSRSFQPQLQLTFDNEPFVPETGAQVETGIKLDLFRRRLSATAAIYQLTRANVSTPDPEHPGFSIQIGEQRSRGFELDLTTQIKPNWNLITTYGYTEAIVTEETDLQLVGYELLGVPRQTASLWSSYAFDQGFARGFGFGAGVFAVGRRFGDLEHTFTVPGYARVDAAVFYKIFRGEKLKYRLAFNLNNVFDKLYYEGVRGRLGIVPGAPINGIGSLQVVF